MAYATWDPSNHGTNVALSDGNLTASGTGGSDFTGPNSVRATLSISSGKWYFEVTTTYATHSGPGFCNGSFDPEGSTWLGGDSHSLLWRNNGIVYCGLGNKGASSFANGDVLQLAIDMDSRKLWIGKNGTWLESGDPAAGTNPFMTSAEMPSGDFFPGAVVYDSLGIVTANFGASAFTYSVPSGFNSGVYEPIVEIEADITDAAAIADTIDGDSPYRDIADAATVADDIIAYSPTEPISDGVALDDSIDSFSLTEPFTDSAGLDDTTGINVHYDEPITDAATIDDGLSGAGSTYYLQPSDAVGISDSFDVFDWSAWLTQYADRFVTRYYFTLTGADDGETDAVIPISSFSIRRRNGDGSYLSVVIPSLAYSTDITLRPNGDMKLEVAYLIANIEVLRETLIVVDLETVRTDEGAKSQSITLDGHRDESFGGQICTPRGVSYKSCTDSKWLVRCLPDPYLRPGDTIRVDGVDLFDCDMVSMYASESYASMEVSES